MNSKIAFYIDETFLNFARSTSDRGRLFASSYFLGMIEGFYKSGLIDFKTYIFLFNAVGF